MRGTTPTWGELFRRSRHEVMTGLLLGVATGLLVATLAAVWQNIAVLFLILLGGIAIGVTGGAVCGLAIPYILHLMSRDPQVAAGPIALASADVIVLLAYFNLALALT